METSNMDTEKGTNIDGPHMDADVKQECISLESESKRCAVECKSNTMLVKETYLDDCKDLVCLQNGLDSLCDIKQEPAEAIQVTGAISSNEIKLEPSPFLTDHGSYLKSQDVDASKKNEPLNSGTVLPACDQKQEVKEDKTYLDQEDQMEALESETFSPACDIKGENKGDDQLSAKMEPLGSESETCDIKGDIKGDDQLNAKMDSLGSETFSPACDVKGEITGDKTDQGQMSVHPVALFHNIYSVEHNYGKQESLQMTNNSRTSQDGRRCKQSEISPVEHLQRNGEIGLGERPYKCVVCYLTFTSAADLKNHSMTHSTDELFKCGECSSAVFHSLIRLKMHIRKHVGGQRCIRTHKDRKFFQCAVCFQSFRCENSLLDHLRARCGEKHQCSDCPSVSGLNHHSAAHSTEKPFKCAQCPSSFMCKSQLIFHMRIHAKETPYLCSCGFSFKTGSELRNHLTTHAEVKPYPCSQCDVSFKIQGELTLHIELQHTQRKTYQCAVCPHVFDNHRSFNVHTATHARERMKQSSLIAHTGNLTREEIYQSSQCTQASESAEHLRFDSETQSAATKLFTCVECFLSYTDLSELKAHAEIHAENRSFLCTHCGLFFKCVKDLDSHAEMHLGQRKYPCSQCASSFTCALELQQHMKSHSSGKPYQCDVCFNLFKSNRNLIKHKQIHSGEKQYQCSQCSKTFMDAGQLKTHSLTHSEDRPFKCELCPSSFKWKSHLDIHVKIHTGEKPFACAHCDSSFKCGAELNRHVRKHSDEKPFLCVLCSSTFKHAKSLKLHMRIHTGEKPYECHHCPEAFNSLEKLNRHMRRVHIFA